MFENLRALRLSVDLGIDLGTSSILVFERGSGIVLNEPSVVAVDKPSGKVLAVGHEARNMLGRTPGTIVATRPLRDGVIADYTITSKMLRHIITKVCGRRRLFKPNLVICVPSGITSVERRAVLQAALDAGAKHAYPLEQPMAAAIGAGLPIEDPGGNMVIDIGGGTTDMAVISLGGPVISQCLRLAGNRMDQAIIRHIRRQHNVMVGERTSEEIKIEIGSACALDPELEMDVRGRDMLSGLPRTITVGSVEIRDALGEPVQSIVDTVKAVLERTPPELGADIIERGITMTGGGALLRGLDTLLSVETDIPVRVATDPITCVAIGTGKALEHLDVVRQTHFVSELAAPALPQEPA